MVVDNVTAFQFSVGVEWAVFKSWFIDYSIQYTQADPDATFYGYTDGVLDETETGHFPMDNVAFRLGVGYSF